MNLQPCFVVQARIELHVDGFSMRFEAMCNKAREMEAKLVVRWPPSNSSVLRTLAEIKTPWLQIETIESFRRNGRHCGLIAHDVFVHTRHVEVFQHSLVGSDKKLRNKELYKFQKCRYPTNRNLKSRIWFKNLWVFFLWQGSPIKMDQEAECSCDLPSSLPNSSHNHCPMFFVAVIWDQGKRAKHCGSKNISNLFKLPTLTFDLSKFAPHLSTFPAAVWWSWLLAHCPRLIIFDRVGK